MAFVDTQGRRFETREEMLRANPDVAKRLAASDPTRLSEASRQGFGFAQQQFPGVAQAATERLAAFQRDPRGTAQTPFAPPTQPTQPIQPTQPTQLFGTAPPQAQPLAGLFGDITKRVTDRFAQPQGPTQAEQLFGRLGEAQAARPSALEILKRHREEQGIAGLQERIRPISQQIRETENILGKVEGDIRLETGGEVTESQRLAVIAQREKPLRGRLLDLFTQRAPMQEELQDKMNLVQQFSDAEIGDAKQEITDIFNLIQANPEEDPTGQLMNDLSILSEILNIEEQMRPEIQRPDFRQVIDAQGNVRFVDPATGEVVDFGGIGKPQVRPGGGGLSPTQQRTAEGYLQQVVQGIIDLEDVPASFFNYVSERIEPEETSTNDIWNLFGLIDWGKPGID